ncbi:MAG: ABC transporter permease [Pseudomonadota bacterium]
MTRAALQALLSHWLRHPLQLLTLLLGLALATGLWTGVQAINSEARASYAAASQALGQGTLDRLVRPGGTVTADEFTALRAAGYLVSPVIEAQLPGGIDLRGIDPFTLPPSAGSPDLTAPDALARFMTPPGVLIAHPETAPAIRARGEAADTSATIPVGQAVGDITTVWRITGREDFDHLVIAPQQPFGLAPLTEVTDLEQVTPTSQNDIAQLTRSFHLNLTAFGLLSFAVGLFIVHAAIGLAFEQRRSVFRTLRALGLSTRRLVTLLALETAVFAVLAGLAGIGLGYLIAALLLPDVAATLRGLYGASVDGQLTLDPAWAASGFGIALLGAAAAAGQSLWRLARLPVLAPARPRAWAMASGRQQSFLAAAGIALLVLAGALLIWGSGLAAGFTLLGAMLVGAALLLPSVLTALLQALQPVARGPLSEWALADTRQQVPGLSLALMALLLALATNIGVGTMVSSFRLTFTGWLDQRLAAELYVTAQDSVQAAEVAALLDARAEATLPIRATDARLDGAPGQIFGVVDHQTYRDGWPLLLGDLTAWDAVALGEATVINEQLHRRSGLGPGDTVELLPGWSLPIAGVYSDYGNPEGQAIVAQSDLLARVPDISPLGYAARIEPAQAPALRAALVGLGVPPANILNQAEVKSFSLAVFDRTFLVTGALNLLTLGVAAFAMLASLTTLAGMRLPQLAPLWALGLTRNALAGLELMRAVAFALATFVMAVPLGLALAWVLLSVVNVEAFGWRLPLHAFPADWARLALWAMVAALLAAALPALRLARMAPARLVKVFADER